MKAIVFKARLNSLYSIRIPYTWQSSLTYPLPPPSSVIGMFANALQRMKNNKHPVKYLEELEEEIVWAGAKLLSPSVIKSYTTSAIVKWEDNIGGKFTNALGRQFGYTKNIQISAIFKDCSFISTLSSALSQSCLTCGDSESPITIEELNVLDEVEEMSANELRKIETEYLFPFELNDIEIISGSGRVYMIHERCMKKSKSFPLYAYLFPMKEENGVLYPDTITVHIKNLQKYELFRFLNQTIIARKN